MLNQLRTKFVEDLRRHLVGPAGAPDEVIKGSPLWRYRCGVLFPSDTQQKDLGILDESDESDEPDTESGIEEQTLEMYYERLQSAMGISFFIKDVNQINCYVEASVYEQDNKDAKEDGWRRQELAGADTPAKVTFQIDQIGNYKSLDLFDGRCKIVIKPRKRKDGLLVTISMVNQQQYEKNKGQLQLVPLMLFQCRFKIEIEGGTIGEYISAARRVRHEEDEELELLFRNRKVFGIGHGCAAKWVQDAPGGIREIFAEPLPATEVQGLTNEINLPEETQSVLSLQYLAQKDIPAAALRDALLSFADEYRDWIAKQEGQISNLDNRYVSPAKRILERQHKADRRIRRGIEALFDKKRDVLAVFRLAQEAMLRQFLWSKSNSEPRDLGDGNLAPIDICSGEHAKEPRWRPFQLAFQLLVIESLIDPTAEERDVLDLLWFPTGGGKTEAYLALAAFEIILRRRTNPDAAGGTAVIMRYTLRLLTAQQFERCATLISVLDWMRRSMPKLMLGEEPIGLGLWVGATTTPNELTRKLGLDPGAKEIFDEQILQDDRPENPFQLLKCPRCGTRIVPQKKSNNKKEYGLKIDDHRFRMNCPDRRCELHHGIPASVVDEDLYAAPPTMLIGTIDKFARMVWKPKSRVFLGQGTDNLPPGLIIQDEMHLINGPLGTIAGVYEAAIETVITAGKVKPKYLAATATIKRAAEQSRLLYGRTAEMFPPPGLDSDDSFFSRIDRKAAGRMFIGILAGGVYSGLESLVQVSAACAAASSRISPNEKLPGTKSSAQDSYWTQVVYHNSRRELGKTTTTLMERVKEVLQGIQSDDVSSRKFMIMKELSANLNSIEIATVKELMQVETPKPDAIDVLACTNMISVGIDISRLGLIIMKGQPKTTAEYIQATSRVGRDAMRAPGIVVTVYTAGRPRDRSHYEAFQSYHQSLYRAVEPVSVTPFAPPAMHRTVHAAVVLTVRALNGWVDDNDARKFDPEDLITKYALETLKTRLRHAASDDGDARQVEQRFDEVVATWKKAAKSDPPLTFANRGKQFNKLLTQYNEKDDGMWPTLNSMRHIDGETSFRVRRPKKQH